MENKEAETERPFWDEYFLYIAEAVSIRGDCTRSQVGAVLVDDRTHRVLSTGYNGVKPGELGCLSGSCPRGNKAYSERPPGGDYSDCIARHAEWNCLYWWRDNLSYQEDFQKVILYITREPCNDCYELMRVFNVSRAVWDASPQGDRFSGSRWPEGEWNA